MRANDGAAMLVSENGIGVRGPAQQPSPGLGGRSELEAARARDDIIGRGVCAEHCRAQQPDPIQRAIGLHRSDEMVEQVAGPAAEVVLGH